MPTGAKQDQDKSRLQREPCLGWLYVPSKGVQENILYGDVIYHMTYKYLSKRDC
jgi:hypothetical protein